MATLTVLSFNSFVMLLINYGNFMPSREMKQKTMICNLVTCLVRRCLGEFYCSKHIHMRIKSYPLELHCSHDQNHSLDLSLGSI